MKDNLFGKMGWLDTEVWQACVQLDQFRDFGDKAFVDDNSTDPMDPDVLYKSGKFLVKIDTRGDRVPPAASQRVAWQALVDRGKGLADELLRAFVDEYQIQRPSRVKWWRAMYGDIPYEERLPETHNVAEIKRLIRPYVFRIQAEAKGKGTAEIGIIFFCTWHSDGLGAVIANGTLVEAGGSYLALPRRLEVTAELVHPVLGKLSRLAGKPALLGSLQLSCFQEFCAIAQARQDFRERPDRVGPPRSKIGWSFARGEFSVWVHAKPDAVPTDAQVAAVTAFKAQESENVAAVVQAVFAEYQKTWE